MFFVTKKADNILGHQVYRKPTHRYMLSHIITQHKNSQLTNLLVHKAFVVSNKEHPQTDFNHLKQALQKT